MWECVMKTFLVPGIVLGALVNGSAWSADLPLRSSYKAPPAEIVFNWSGFYVGGHLGYGFAQADIGSRNLFKQVVAPAQRIDADGFLGGVQAGWNHQIDRFVLGAEVDFSWSDIEGDVRDTILAGNKKVSAGLSSNATWIATATARVGYAWDQFLVYGKVGAAWAHFDYGYDDSVTMGRTTTVHSASASETRSGWTVGTGVEWAFWGNWSAKAEYNYIDLGNRTVNFTPVGGNPDIKQRISVVKAGLNYRFGQDIVIVKY
jgi:outer membrane immunogenic protein